MRQYSRRPSPRRPAAWTLVQLLVVLGIIAVLAGLLVPATLYGLARARKTICIAHLRTIHAAIMLYAADHDRHLPLVHYPPTIVWDTGFADWKPETPWPQPPPPSWYTLRVPLGDYIDDPRVFFCPADPVLPVTVRAAWPRRVWTTYHHNPDMSALDLDRLSWPPEKADLAWGPARCHFGKSHQLWLDGHIRAVRGAITMPIRYNYERYRELFRGAGGDPDDLFNP